MVKFNIKTNIINIWLFMWSIRYRKLNQMAFRLIIDGIY
jgi:hypothetical protein